MIYPATTSLQTPEEDSMIRKIRSQYGINPTKRHVEITIDYKLTDTQHENRSDHDSVKTWVMRGLTIVDGVPLKHIVEGDDRYDCKHYRSKLIQHLRMYADAYSAGERWE